jgi:shikimate dehydrogenase
LVDETVTLERYGVMGYPVSHSRSPVIHRLFALQTGQNIQYELLQVAPQKLEQAVRQFQRTGGRGLNITVPHKSPVTRLCDQLSERASTAGAVNTLAFQDNEIFGDNTDGIGLLRDLAINLGINLEGADILILGAGGATRGITGPLLEMLPKSLVLANRSLDKAKELADQFEKSGPISACRFNGLPANQNYDLVINATSAGVRGETPPFPPSCVSSISFCYDLAYGLKGTPFTTWARQHDAGRTAQGWGMLVEQAAESFEIWRGIRPNTAEILSRMPV